MKNTLYILETAKQTFITVDRIGQNHLHASDTKDYYLGEKFDNEIEAKTFEELLNTGATSNPHIRPNWKVTVDTELLPVKKRTLTTELLPS